MIVPSILSADFSCLGNQIKEIEETGARWIHLDIMDGHFVPNISFGADIVKAIRRNTKLFFDIHLMVENPDKFIEDFAKAGADSISISVEACPHFHKTIYNIKELGCRAGVVLKPATSLESIEWVLEDLDLVLLMSVNPGFSGQKFIYKTIPKITELRNKIDEKKLKTLIGVDGGICPKNASLIKKSGADILVAGSAIFNQKSIKKAFKNLKEKIK